MKKYGIILLIVLALTVALITIPIFATSENTDVIYVANGGTGNGSSADAPMGDLFAAINALPERVTYEHKALVAAARAAYAKIATTEQQALVTNYAALISAEQRIIALTPEEKPEVQETPATIPDNGWMAVIVIVLGVAALATTLYLERKREKPAPKATDDQKQTEE